LFGVTVKKTDFRHFGVIEAKVQQNLTIILEPQRFMASNGRWGVHPDETRTRLIFSGNGEKGIDPPLADWGQEFAEKMPQPILQAILDARGEFAGDLEDDEYRKRLQDRFGDRWRMKVLVQATKKDKRTIAATTDGTEEVEVIAPPEIDEPGPGPGPGPH